MKSPIVDPNKPIILKVGGRQLDDSVFLRRLAAWVLALPEIPVIVHGGGKATSQLCARLGINSQFSQGLRVTDESTLEAAVMGLVGTASMTLVRALVEAGCQALGLCGADAHLVECEPVSDPPGLGSRRSSTPAYVCGFCNVPSSSVLGFIGPTSVQRKRRPRGGRRGR